MIRRFAGLHTGRHRRGYDQTVGITQTRAQVLSGYPPGVGPAFPGLANQYRIVAPRTSPVFNAGGAQANHPQGVIDQVWSGRECCAAFNRGVAQNPNTADRFDPAKYYPAGLKNATRPSTASASTSGRTRSPTTTSTTRVP